MFYKVFGLTSSNAVLYYIQDHNGRIQLSNDDLTFDESDKLVFMIDLSSLFRLSERLMSAVIGYPLIETTWDRKNGHGIIKETRPDGTKFLIVLARHVERGKAPKGLFIGGDLPYGDTDRWRKKTSNNTGMSYYDGSRWNHLWCTINEGVSLRGKSAQIDPLEWEYHGSRIIRSTFSEITIESLHELKTSLDDQTPVDLIMKRTVSKNSGDDYIIVRVSYKNAGALPLTYDWSYGDEPWVGEFGDSAGDVGWTDGEIHQSAGYISPREHRFAGYWDIGNELAGERHDYSGYANFIEWLSNPPTVVYFSNGFAGSSAIPEHMPLNSPDNRVINLLWKDQTLKPGDGNTYVLALGMAKPDPHTNFPAKPSVRPH